MARHVEHLVLFKPSADATNEQQRAVVEHLLALKDVVPGILSATGGINFSERSAGYGIGIVMRFESREALDAYIPHPAHRSAVETYVRPATDGVIVVDYEI